jgi:CRP-like cAMP-binding protein
MSNTSRDRVNRALQRFRKAGWVDLRYQTIIIRDPAALEHFARVGS